MVTQPYADSAQMRADVRRDRLLYIYPTSGMSPDHPLAQPAAFGWCWNDVFRAVHDLVGHAATGFQFGPVGEENAFRFHATVMSADELPALAAETRLQNCWVNFGPHLRDAHGNLVHPGDAGFIPASAQTLCGAKSILPCCGGHRLHALAKARRLVCLNPL